MQEIWKDIKGYEKRYQISNLGRVKSLKHYSGVHNKYNDRVRIKKQQRENSGYFVVGLNKNKSQKIYKVHRLVAEAFIPNPDNKPQVNHINGIKTDNRACNLEWNTRSENMQHASKNNLLKPAKTRIIQYSKAMKEIRLWDSMMDIEKNLKIKHNNISLVCNGFRKTAGGFVWKFADNVPNRK